MADPIFYGGIGYYGGSDYYGSLINTRDKRASVLCYCNISRIFPNPDNNTDASNRSFLAGMYNWDLAYTPAGGYDDDRAAWIGLPLPFIRVYAEPDGTISEYDRGQILGTLRRVELGATIASLTGVSSTAQAGTLTSIGNALITLTSVSTTSGIGTISINGDVIATPTGVSSSATAGNISADTGHRSAWWSSNWFNSLWWNDSWWVVGPTTTITLTGVSTTGQVGDPAITGTVTLSIDGVETTAGLGSLSIITPTETTVILQGVTTTSGLGTLTLFGDALADLAGEGVESTSAAGTLTVIADSIAITIDGVSSTISLGDLTIAADGIATITGVEANPIADNLSVFFGYPYNTDQDRVELIEAQDRTEKIQKQYRTLAITRQDKKITIQ